MITFSDFQKLDIRIGTIIDVNNFPEARKAAWQMKIDFGSLGIKQSSAQITDLYNKKTLLNKQVIAVVNLPKKQIANFFSECLVLGFVNEDQKVVLISADQPLINGSRLS